MPELGSLITSWDGNCVVSRFDKDTGTWIFIALHDDTMGRARAIFNADTASQASAITPESHLI